MLLHSGSKPSFLLFNTHAHILMPSEDSRNVAAFCRSGGEAADSKDIGIQRAQSREADSDGVDQDPSRTVKSPAECLCTGV